MSINPTFCSPYFCSSKEAPYYLVNLCISQNLRKKKKFSLPTMVKRESSGGQNGRRKEMQRIENKNARQVCFSKRRNGLFKKASELATMCGAEVAILVESPAGRPYTFGSPAVNPVINRFLSNNFNEPDHSSSKLLSSINNQNPHQNNILNHLNQQYNDISSRLDAARFRQLMLEERLKQAAKETPVCIWYEKREELDLDQLKQLLEALSQTKAMLKARQNELICAGGASTSQIVNYPNPLASTVMANTSFPNQMAHQQEPRMIDYEQPSFNPSLRVGLNINMTPVTSPMMSFDPRTYGKSCDYVVGSSSKSEECVPHSIGGFGLGSIRSEMYPMNIAAVNQGLIRLNSFSFGSKDADAEADEQYEFKAFEPLELVDSTAQGQFIPEMYGTSGQNLHVEDLIAQNNQADPGPSGANINKFLGPGENEPYR